MSSIIINSIKAVRGGLSWNAFKYFTKLERNRAMLPMNNVTNFVRFYSKKCKEPRKDECERDPKERGCYKLNCKTTMGLAKKSPCEDNCDPTTNKRKPKKEKKEQFRSMWDSPECLTCPCPDVLPRFDALYYKSSNKKTARYQQTWVSCPRRRIVKKKICEFPEEEDPPMARRPKKCPKPKTACSFAREDSLMECETRDARGACVKIRLPGCKLARNPPKCFSIKGPSDCKKIRCPFPAFSECNRPDGKKPRPNECGCRRQRPMCEIYMVARKRGLI